MFATLVLLAFYFQRSDIQDSYELFENKKVRDYLNNKHNFFYLNNVNVKVLAIHNLLLMKTVIAQNNLNGNIILYCVHSKLCSLS